LCCVNFAILAKQLASIRKFLSAVSGRFPDPSFPVLISLAILASCVNSAAVLSFPLGFYPADVCNLGMMAHGAWRRQNKTRRMAGLVERGA
jgi:hypothetical protein